MAELRRATLATTKLEVARIAYSLAGHRVTRGRRQRYLFDDHPGWHPDAGQDARIEMSKLREETDLALMARGGPSRHLNRTRAYDFLFLRGKTPASLMRLRLGGKPSGRGDEPRNSK